MRIDRLMARNCRLLQRSNQADAGTMPGMGRDQRVDIRPLVSAQAMSDRERKRVRQHRLAM